MFRKLLFLLALLLSTAALAQPLGTYKDEDRGYTITLKSGGYYSMSMPRGIYTGRYEVKSTTYYGDKWWTYIDFYHQFGKPTYAMYQVSASGYRYLEYGDSYFYLQGPNGIDKEIRAQYLKEKKEEEARERKAEAERQKAEAERQRAEAEAKRQEELRVQNRIDLVRQVSNEFQSVPIKIDAKLTTSASDQDEWLLPLSFRCSDIAAHYMAEGNTTEAEKWQNYANKLNDMFKDSNTSMSNRFSKNIANIGDYFYYRKDYDMALRIYQFSGESDCYEKSGNIYYEKGDKENAFKCYMKVKNSLSNNAKFNLAELCRHTFWVSPEEREQNVKLAKELYSSLTSSENKYRTQSYKALGRLYFAEGDMIQAI